MRSVHILDKPAAILGLELYGTEHGVIRAQVIAGHLFEEHTGTGIHSVIIQFLRLAESPVRTGCSRSCESQTECKCCRKGGIPKFQHIFQNSIYQAYKFTEKYPYICSLSTKNLNK